MSSRPETPTHAPPAHTGRTVRRATALRRARWRSAPPARYEPYLDGLFTYCLSVLCDHDAATAALGDVLALAERRGTRGPEPAEDRTRSWLYALARWACLRELAEAKRKRQGTHAVRPRRPRREAPTEPAAVRRRSPSEAAPP